MLNHESYFSRKKIYGFNLQAICDDRGQFIYASLGYTASTHDSTAFKGSTLYPARSNFINSQEYLLADKAYQLNRHIITPYKLPAARAPHYRLFNKAHSNRRIKIEHSFSVLKARWASLKGLPIRIRQSPRRDHGRVFD